MDPPSDREYGPWLDQFGDALLPGLLALDLGSGHGDDALELCAHGLRVIGMDVSRERVQLARQRVPATMFIVADLSRQLPLRSDIADIVTASLSLHYFDLRTTRAIVNEIARVLRPGGVLLARVNAVGDEESGYGTGVQREAELFEVEPGRLKRFFTDATVRDLVEPTFGIDAIRRQRTHGRAQATKQTVVFRARVLGKP